MPESRELTQSKSKAAAAAPPSKEEILKPFEEAYRDFLEATKNAWTVEDFQKRSVDAFLEYVRSLQDAGDDQFRGYEAYFRYARAQQDALVPDDVRQRFDDAFNEYVRKVKDAWANLNVEAVDPATLVCLNQAVLNVALQATQAPTKR